MIERISPCETSIETGLSSCRLRLRTERSTARIRGSVRAGASGGGGGVIPVGGSRGMRAGGALATFVVSPTTPEPPSDSRANQDRREIQGERQDQEDQDGRVEDGLGRLHV